MWELYRTEHLMKKLETAIIVIGSRKRFYQTFSKSSVHIQDGKLCNQRPKRQEIDLLHNWATVFILGLEHFKLIYVSMAVPSTANYIRKLVIFFDNILSPNKRNRTRDGHIHIIGISSVVHNTAVERNAVWHKLNWWPDPGHCRFILNYGAIKSTRFARGSATINEKSQICNSATYQWRKLQIFLFYKKK